MFEKAFKTYGLYIKLGAVIVAVSLIFATGAWVGNMVSDSGNADKISQLEKDLGAARSAEALSAELNSRFQQYCGAIDAATKKQDEAIVELWKLADAQREAAAAATDQAKKDSARFQRDAALILGKRAPPGVDECVAARDEFNTELRDERKRVKP